MKLLKSDKLIIGILICHYIAIFITVFVTNAMYNSEYYHENQDCATKLIKYKSDLEIYRFEAELNPILKESFKATRFLGIILIEMIVAVFVVIYFFHLRKKVDKETIEVFLVLLFIVILFDAINDVGVFLGMIYYGQLSWIQGIKDALAMNVSKIVGR